MTSTPPAQAQPGLAPELRTAYRRLVAERFGLRLAEHQARQLDETVARLLALTDDATPLDLYEALAAGRRPDLLEALAASAAVGETYFFRVGPQIDALRSVVLPELIGRRAAERRLRIWSAGCSTGEEPYTLAMLIREQLPALGEWDLQLLATDMSRPALAAARQAVYGEWSFRETPDQVRQRYFIAEGKRWRLVESVRNMVRFAQLNLAAEAFPSAGPNGSDLDLILCRNVTIYFSAEATQQLYRRLAAALVPGGWLVLGPSDAAPELPGLLDPVYLPGAVLWRRAAAEQPAPRPRPPLSTASAAADVLARLDSVDRMDREGAAGLPSQPRVRPRRPGIGKPDRSPPPAPPPPPAEDGAPDLDRVRALAQRGERRAARQQAERLARSQPLAVEAHLLLGLLDLDEGAIAPAIESLRRATFLDPQNALAHFSLGRAYLGSGDTARAQAALTQARRILAATADDEPIPGGNGLLVGDLRTAVDAQIAGLGRLSKS